MGKEFEVRKSIDLDRYRELEKKNTSRKGNITAKSYTLEQVYRFGTCWTTGMESEFLGKLRYSLINKMVAEGYVYSKETWDAIYRASRVYEQSILSN